MRRLTRRARDERGTVLVLWALLLTGLLTMVALVVDLGHVRAGTRANQATADLAALAGTERLARGDFAGACAAAVNYLNVNTKDMPAISPTPFCGQAGNDVASTVCTGGPLAQAAPTATSGRYTVSVHMPVPDAEIADRRYGPGLNDGTPCQRMRVIVSTEERTFFSGIVGVNGLRTTRSATAKLDIRRNPVPPALWLLDPYGCTPLSVSGGSTVDVGTATVPGVVTIDSDGSACNSNQYTVTATGNGTRLRAFPQSGSPVGMVSLYALRPGATTCSAPACDPSDVSGGRISPQPIRAGERATRAPVDWRFDCRSGYSSFHGVEIPDCLGGGPGTAYITTLVGAVGSSGNPGGFQRWTATYGCNPSGTITVSGNWWIDCPGGLAISNGTSVTFKAGNVVLDGQLSMTGGSLSFNTANLTEHLPDSCLPPKWDASCVGASSSGAAFVYVRNGDWNVTGGNLTVKQALIYERSGVVKVAGGAPPTWIAPIEGPFAGLALWSEQASNKFQINGGAGVTLSGVFFTPEANPMTLSGGGDWGQQHAQFVSFRLAVSGGSKLAMTPDPDTAIGPPPKAGTLIR